jgi:hypothetical protein
MTKFFVPGGEEAALAVEALLILSFERNQLIKHLTETGLSTGLAACAQFPELRLDLRLQP